MRVLALPLVRLECSLHFSNSANVSVCCRVTKTLKTQRKVIAFPCVSTPSWQSSCSDEKNVLSSATPKSASTKVINMPLSYNKFLIQKQFLTCERKFHVVLFSTAYRSTLLLITREYFPLFTRQMLYKHRFFTSSSANMKQNSCYAFIINELWLVCQLFFSVDNSLITHENIFCS